MSFWVVFTIIYALVTPLIFILVKTETRGLIYQIAWLVLYMVPALLALFM